MRHSRIRVFIKEKRDFIIITIIGIIAFMIASFFDFFELIYKWSRLYEKWNIDEIISMIVVLFFVLMINFFKQWKFAKKELKKSKKNETELKMSRERLKILTKILRHDLTNDVVVINSAVNIFNRTSNQEMLTEIKNRSEKILERVDYYKKYELIIDSNGGLEPIEISELLFDLAAEFPKLEFDIVGSCQVFADYALRSVFINLIFNSILHGNSTKIEVLITSDKQHCKIQFCDNGKGIPNEIKKSIFDEGFSYGETGHTGVGLYIVKKTIEHYKGSIVIENDNPIGTMFTIKLNKVLT